MLCSSHDESATTPRELSPVTVAYFALYKTRAPRRRVSSCLVTVAYFALYPRTPRSPALLTDAWCSRSARRARPSAPTISTRPCPPSGRTPAAPSRTCRETAKCGLAQMASLLAEVARLAWAWPARLVAVRVLDSGRAAPREEAARSLRRLERRPPRPSVARVGARSGPPGNASPSGLCGRTSTNRSPFETAPSK